MTATAVPALRTAGARANFIPRTAEAFAAIREEAPAQESAVRSALTRVKDAIVDVRASTRAFRFTTTAPVDGGLEPMDRLQVETPAGLLVLTKGAHAQVAEKLGVHASYYNRCLEHYPQGLVDHLNWWLQSEKDVRLLRMLRPVTEQDEQRLVRTRSTLTLRAYLADGFRTLDNYEVAESALASAAERGAIVKEWNLSEDKFYLRLIDGEPDDVADVIRRARAARNYDEQRAIMREPFGFGVTVRNSETGNAMLEVAPYVLILRCVNGIWVSESLKQRHVGRARGADESWLGADTRALDDAAAYLKVRDHVREAFGEAPRLKVAEAIAAAAGEPVDVDAEAPLFAIVAGAANRFGMPEREQAVMVEELTNEAALAGGTPTRWSVSQALTATARRIVDVSGYERKVELEKAGWQVLETPVQALVKEAQAATRRTN